MTLLVTADLHLSDRPKDRHRFGLFKWLGKQQEKHNPKATLILGDLTDKKDNHSSELVNHLINDLIGLKPPVYVLKGNHDYLSPENPFFGFLSHIEGLEFISAPRSPWAGTWMIPHCSTQSEFDNYCGNILPKSDLVCLHTCIDGAVAESGVRLSGLRWPPVSLKSPPLVALAGDIHRPQRLASGLVYVGAPYSIRFNDDFLPRVLLVQGSKLTDLHFPAPRKWTLTIRDAEELTRNDNLHKGDQVKLIIELAREEAISWSAHKQQALDVCKELGLEVFGVSVNVNTNRRRERIRLDETSRGRLPEDVLIDFCTSEGVASNVKQIGLELVQPDKS